MKKRKCESENEVKPAEILNGLLGPLTCRLQIKTVCLYPWKINLDLAVGVWAAGILVYERM